MPPLLPLHMLRPGQSAHIHTLMGLPDQIHRLEELGLRKGVPVEMVQAGNPCIIRLPHSKMCFRHGEAMGVMVEQTEQETAT